MPSNAIVLENLLPGSPRSEWDPTMSESTNIQGFADNISVNQGDKIDFKIESDAAYSIEIYRLGYYQGNGARLIDTIEGLPAVPQPDPIRVASTGMVDAGNWSVTASWAVPEDLTSGVFIAKLTRADGLGVSHIPFIVRADESNSDIVFQTSDQTWQAYNTWGSQDADGNGASLYGGDAPPDRAYAVSYNRPFVVRDQGPTGPNPWNFIFGPEFSAIYWLEQNGYDVSYIAGADTDRDGEALVNHNVFLTAGHDEYWSGPQRSNVEAARDAGVNLAFWTGNEMYWRVRWEESVDGTNTPYRTLVSYKESFVGDIDPSNEWTGTFRDGRFTSATAIGGGVPENAVTGTMFGSGNEADWFTPEATISVPYDMSQLRFWRSTSVADTLLGQSTLLGDNLLKHEYDVSPDNGFRPPGLIPLSSSPLSHATAQVINEFGTSSAPGLATHNLTLYRDPESGSLVFGAGATFWSWGLAGDMDVGTGTQPSHDVQQAMVNLLADMGAQPETLQSGLVHASASDDFTAPSIATVGIDDDPAAASLGQLVTIHGTATDDDGNPSTPDGKVAAVEVSTNGGVTWHPADGTTDWTYQWVAQDVGAHILMARAVDDSLNVQYEDVARTDLEVIPIREVVGTSTGENLVGGDGQDWIYGLDGLNELVGGKGNDFIFGGNDQDWEYGGSGIDELHGGRFNDYLFGGSEQDYLYGEDGVDEAVGGSGGDVLAGGNDQDWLYGEDGADRLEGGAGNDYLFGGIGKDQLNGGSGADTFGFASVDDAGRSSADCDIIEDFEKGIDKIDITGLLPSGRDPAFTADPQPFSVWMQIDGVNNVTMISGDNNGDNTADFQIDLSGPIRLDASDLLMGSRVG